MKTMIKGGTDRPPKALVLRTLDELNERFGIDFGGPGLDDFINRVSMARDDMGYETIERFLRELKDERYRGELTDVLIDRLFNNESYFLRHRSQLDAIVDVLMPELSAIFRNARQPLRVWHAGCARGEEPYSMAMMLQNNSRGCSGGRVEITGTDVNGRNIDQARSGRYSKWSLRNIDDSWLYAFFKIENGNYLLKDRIKSKVRFVRHNLVDGLETAPHGPENPAHLILCRNVLMYMTGGHFARVIASLHDALAPGGYLVLSPSEYLNELDHPFEEVSMGEFTAYRKRTEPGNFRIELLPAMERKPKRPSKTKTVARTKAPQEPSMPSEERIPKGREGAEESLGEVFQRGDFLSLGKLADEFISHFPFRATGYYYRAVVLLEGGMDEQAFESLRQCLYLDSHFIAARIQLAGVCQRLGKTAEHYKAILAIKNEIAGLDPSVEIPFTDGMTVGELALLISEEEEPEK